MPPMKKFRSVEIANTVTSASGLALPPKGEVNKHRVMLNGPTLSPQGQISSLYPNGLEDQPAPQPPGLRDSSQPPAPPNGYTNDARERNGYHPELALLNEVRPSLQDTTQSLEKPTPAGWSARYSPSQSTQPTEQLHFSPAPQDPFLNSFESQRPKSPHITYKIPSPTKNPSPLSPSQIGDDAVYCRSPNANGSPAHQLPPNTPRLPSYSPIKQQSSPPMPAVHHSSSSPTMHPHLHKNPPSSPGFSPTKHSPPRSFGTGEITSAPVLPPVESLSPSPQVPNPLPPMKVVNGDMHEA
jgi:hypothetical protein